MVLPDDLKDFSDLIDSGLEEGRGVIYNAFGYSNFSACPDCIGSVESDIERQREEDAYHEMMEEEYYWEQKRKEEWDLFDI